MRLRTRLALIVAVTVLVASAVGGVGVALTSRSIGTRQIDSALRADAAHFDGDATGFLNQVQFALELRSSTCIDDLEDTQFPERERRRSERRPDRSEQIARIIPEFASELQVIQSGGQVIAPCEQLPVADADFAVASRGRGSHYRTVTDDGERWRIYTRGYDDLGAIQFARSLELTDRIRIVCFGALGAVLAGAVGWLTARRATERVERLSDAAKRVGTTRDLGERIDVEGDDEIATLAVSFNAMLESLDTSREQQHRLVQDASHELRTPLTSMRTNIELLQRHSDIPDDTRRQVIDDIGVELVELTALTRELVDSATAVPSHLVTTEPVELERVVERAVERARRRYRRPISLSIDDPATVQGDVGLLDRAVTNLVDNAAKFSDDSAEIEVTLQGGELRVLDRGPGIEAADLERVFDRFYRATSARSEPGSGLGLAIVRQIVEGHGGTIDAKNRSGGGLDIGFGIGCDEPPAAVE